RGPAGGLGAGLPGDCQARLVEAERPRDRRDGPESGEPECEHRLPHLRAVAPALVLAPEPRPGFELATGCELVAADVLGADGAVVEEHTKRERPLLRAPLPAHTEVVVECRVDELLTGPIRPGHAEGHLVRRMYTAIREACELGDLLLRSEPQLDALGAQPQAEERRQVYCRTLT